jgi:hypothetical protein
VLGGGAVQKTTLDKKEERDGRRGRKRVVGGRKVGERGRERLIFSQHKPAKKRKRKSSNGKNHK